MATLISENILYDKNISRDKEGHCRVIKMLTWKL
jgi:hypothetical protein